MSLLDNFHGQRYLTLEENDPIVKEGGGSGGSGLIVNFIYNTEEPHDIVAIDKTYNEITSVLNAGGCVRVKNVTEQAQEGATMTTIDYLDIISCSTIAHDDPTFGTQYGVFINFKNGEQYIFSAHSPNDTLRVVK